MVWMIALFMMTLTARANVGGQATGVYLSPEQVASLSQGIATVKIERVIPVLLNGHVWTEAHCAVNETWKGEPAANVIVRQAGGTLGELRTQSGPRPDFMPGEEWLLAMVPSPAGDWTLLGLVHGAWRLSGNEATRDYAGVIFAAPPPADIAEGRYEHTPLTELRTRMSPPDFAAMDTHGQPRAPSQGDEAPREGLLMHIAPPTGSGTEAVGGEQAALLPQRSTTQPVAVRLLLLGLFLVLLFLIVIGCRRSCR
ncbi:MAG TPA: hypothetical protein DCR55_12760 [Lentisphaeria bacterium]|nr:hypothetical protein [Lentisphaeria bacterium]